MEGYVASFAVLKIKETLAELISGFKKKNSDQKIPPYQALQMNLSIALHPLK